MNGDPNVLESLLLTSFHEKLTKGLSIEVVGRKMINVIVCSSLFQILLMDVTLRMGKISTYEIELFFDNDESILRFICIRCIFKSDFFHRPS